MFRFLPETDLFYLVKRKIQQFFSENSLLREGGFVVLYYSLLLTWLLFRHSDFNLQSFAGRPVSIATAEGVDIADRVGTFYRAIFSFIILCIAFAVSLKQSRRFISRADLKILTITSLAGACMLFFQILGADCSPVLHLIFAIHFAVLVGVIGKRVLNSEIVDEEYLKAFTWLSLLSFSLFFFFWHVLEITSGIHLHSLPDFLAVSVSACILVFLFLSRKNALESARLRHLIWITKPMVFFPFLSFAAQELSQIFQQRGTSVSVSIFYFLGVLLMATFVFLRSKKQSANPNDAHSLLAESWIPWLLAGFTCLAFYKPVVTPEFDWFEDANRILPLQQFAEFHKIPFFDTFNSHAMYDWFWGAVYSLFNGYDPLGGYVYGFAMSVIFTLVIYFLVLRLSGNAALSVFVALFYPYEGFILPGYYNIIPVSVLLLLRLAKDPTVKNYFLYFFFLAFMLVWRIDLGLANFFAGFAGFVFLVFFTPGFTTNWKDVLKGAFWVKGIALFVFLVALVMTGPKLLFNNLAEALGYMSSMQSYGLKDLASASNINYYSLYFVMPAVILIISGYALVKLIRSGGKSSPEAVVSLALLFFSVFYFANLQRGLVRHTLAEGWDTALTSYGFFILAAPVFYSKKWRTSPALQFFAFFVVSTIVVINYKSQAPDLIQNNVYKEVVARVQEPAQSAIQGNDRTIEAPGYKSYGYADLDVFLKKTIADSASFLDFSNTPMLYYFLHRSTPNYLCQIPHTAHNDRMQDRFLAELEGKNLPVTLFSNYPPSYWDNLDGIPNTMRHYKISEYIYRNYEPSAVMNHHTVWMKNGSPPAVFNNRVLAGIRDLRPLSIVDVVLTDSITLRATGGQPQISNLLSHSIHLDATKKYYVTLNGWFDREGTVSVLAEFNKNGFQTERKSDTRVFSGPSKAFAVLEPKADENELTGLRILLPQGATMALSGILLNECDVVPDEVSTLPADYSLKNIPFIWGQFDGATNAAPECTVLRQTKVLENEKAVKVLLPSIADREHGQYIRLSIRPLGDKPVDLIMRYGKEQETQGGFAFIVHPSEKAQTYLVRVSTQYNWVKKEHNWLSFYPMGGAIEFTGIDILKGD